MTSEDRTDALWAVSNLRTLRENIYSYMTFARGVCDDMELHDLTEQAQAAIDKIIKHIEDGLQG